MKIELFIDFVCPFCFLVEDELAELASDRDVEVEIRPFELRPDPVPTLRPQDDYLPRVWRESVYPMAARLGVDIRLPTISPQPRSEHAFIVAQLAAERGLSAEFAHAVFSAFFVEDRDIGDAAVLTEIAGSVGLDRPAVQAALASDERRVRHARELRYATNTVGVRAVPTFRIGERAYPGVLSATDLRRVVDMTTLMEAAVERSIEHVAEGGLPFVGVVAAGDGYVSEFGTNRVSETGDPSAHAEIVAMRAALGDRGSLEGATLLATGEPCGLCYRFAVEHGVSQIYVAVDRDTVASHGIDYRASYSLVDERRLAGVLQPLPVARGLEPFYSPKGSA